MNAHPLPYTATNHQSEKGNLLEMVWRLAPLFMRRGGAPCSSGPENERADPLTANEKRSIYNLVKAGHDLHDIADTVGRHYTTVARHSRHLRTRGRGRPKESP